MNDNISTLNKLEQNFRELIIERCKFCGFDRYLGGNPDFEFPKITEDLMKTNVQGFISVPGLFGGYAYYVELVNNEPALYAEQSSRMDYSSDDYLYFEITLDNSRLLQGEEREVVQKKFCELAKKAHEKHLQELETMRKKTKE